MQSITAYIATASLGAMLFLSFVLVPLILGRLPAQKTGTMLRGVFPRYYVLLGALTAEAIVAGIYCGSAGVNGRPAKSRDNCSATGPDLTVLFAALASIIFRGAMRQRRQRRGMGVLGAPNRRWRP